MNAFSPNANLITFTPGFTSVGNLVPSPVTIQTVTITSHGENGPDPYTTWLGIQNNANESGWFANIPGSSQGNIALDNCDQTDLLIDFSTPVSRAGLLLASPVSQEWTVDAYDDDLDLLGTFEVSNTARNAVFAGYEASVDIRRLEVIEPVSNAYVTAFDDIRFEVVPEPESLGLLLAFGAVLVILNGTFRRRL